MKRIDKVLPVGLQQFEMRQPDGEKDSLVDKYYYDLTNRLISTVNDHDLLPEWPGVVVARALMGVVGYFQDIVVDSGVWRSFIDMNRRLYGKTLPFYEVSEEYIDHELNKEDIRFLLWYSLSLNFEDKYTSDPLAEDIREAADNIYSILDSVYDDAPEDVCWKQTRGLELSDPEDARRIYRYSNWLFMYCYLMSPAYSATLMNIMTEPEMQSPDPKTIEQRIERSMVEDPVGPLALFLKEWLYLILEGRLPADAPAEDSVNVEEHPYWKPFTEATKGERIMFFRDYEQLNNFFIEILGWAPGEEHLSQMKPYRDFVLLVDRKKGLLLAKNVARCIKYPSNPFYDSEYAKDHALDLLTVRGFCPADLLKFIEENKALPDAHFSGSDNTSIVVDNFDFIARCYLQIYYRGD
ncbi:MAG: DUF3843 family protein [Clostridium sp.]|nr:DUF3843 family protein [Prevotella sp.]MCM1428678.1 DUF3843 family protein [Clostridium sp.]MCM1475053.1 DUF3843 family protein [Muribaculaceae bacterium]